MSQCCNKFIFDDTPDTFQMWQGLRGPYFTPHVAENGDLSWSNNGQLPNPETVNIKGPPGPGGVPGGTTGQLLAKASDENYDTEWIDPPDLDAGHVEYDPAETYDDGSVGKELTTINSALSSLSAVTEIIDTASGAIASFPDGSGLPMRSLVAQINPVQDLHGYTQPWAGGSGKNKLPLPPAETKNGITLAHNTDGSITLTGTSTEITYFDFDTDFNSTLYAGYILSGYPSGYSGDTTSINFRICSASSRAAVQDYLSSGTGIIEDNGEHLRIALRVAGNYAIPSGGLVFKPMLRASTDSDTFQPYSNECPITGWTGLSGERLGVNQWDEQWENGDISSVTGQNEGNTLLIRTVGYIPVDESKSYYFFCGSQTTGSPRARFYDKNKEYIGYSTASGQMVSLDTSFTPPTGACYMRFAMQATYGNTYLNDISVNYPATVTTYNAYTSLPITCTWQSEAGTVYDGYIDVVSGLLTVDTAVETENGGNPYWQLNTGGVGRFYLPSLPSGLNTSRKAESICNVLTYKDDNTVYGSFFVYGGSGLYVNKISADETLEQFKTRISNPALQIIYPLATPQTYQLTPQQISTLLGNNTVFVDCGSVSVTYQASIKGYIDKVLGA